MKTFRARAQASLIRTRGLLVKEWLQIIRDPSAIAIALALPVALLLLFGYGVSLDAEHVPVAVTLESDSAEARDFIGRLALSRTFRPRVVATQAEAEAALAAHEVDAILRIRPDFARAASGANLGARGAGGGGPALQLVVNGVDANRARQIIGYVGGVFQKWQEGRALTVSPAQPPTSNVIRPTGQPLVQVEERMWFNSERRSQNFLVPGLLVVIMTLSGSLLTAMVMAREWERGTMEALLVTPVRVGEILVGKLLPYFGLGMGGMALAVFMAQYVFDVPLRGSLWLLVVCSGFFLLTALGLGLFISVVAKNQFVAGQAAILAAFLPSFFLSGFLFDLRNAPTFIQVISHAVAARYFTDIVKTLFLAGDIWPVIWPNVACMLVLAGVFLTLARRMTRKRLEG